MKSLGEKDSKMLHFFFLCVLFLWKRGKIISGQTRNIKELDSLKLQECAGDTGSPDPSRVKVAEQRQFLDSYFSVKDIIYICPTVLFILYYWIRIEESWLCYVIYYAELISMPTHVYTKGATVTFMETRFRMHYIPEILCRLLILHAFHITSRC